MATLSSFACLSGLYYRYKQVSDEDIRQCLKGINLVRRKEGRYHPLTDAVVDKIKANPRETALTFEGAETDSCHMVGLKSYKRIVYLVKSSSRFFLKPDIGEIFDAIGFEERISGRLQAICIEEDYELLPETDGEHFLMTAELLTFG